MLDIAIAGRRLRVTEPEKIPDEGVAKALIKLAEMRTAEDRAEFDRNALNAAVTELRNRGGRHLAEAFLADPFAEPEDPNAELEAAERALTNMQTRLAAMAGGQGLAINEFMAEVDRARATWSKTLVGRVPASLRKISTAIKLLRDAEAELIENLDMLQGLSEGGYSSKNSGAGTYVTPLAQSIAAAALALASGTAQLEALKSKPTEVTL